jgi:hypothetical protein
MAPRHAPSGQQETDTDEVGGRLELSGYWRPTIDPFLDNRSASPAKLQMPALRPHAEVDSMEIQGFAAVHTCLRLFSVDRVSVCGLEAALEIGN